MKRYSLFKTLISLNREERAELVSEVRNGLKDSKPLWPKLPPVLAWLRLIALAFCGMMVLGGLLSGAWWQVGLGVAMPLIGLAAYHTRGVAGLQGESIHTPRDSLKAWILFGDDDEKWSNRFDRD